MPREYKERNTRIPMELDGRIEVVVAESGRYKSVAAFIESALWRLVTFEEGELASRRKMESERAAIDAAQIKINFNS
jgi:Arc/MetJ-type ribon-helix-helix transcriptional regulator